LRQRVSRPAIFTLSAILLMYFFGLLLSGCASADVPPSAENPKVACIAKSPFLPLQKQTHTGNRILPEVVYVIGETPATDGQRWMVIRGVYIAAKCRGELLSDFRSCEWVPFEKTEIQFHGCGPDAMAHQQIAAAGMVEE
jgi:hypothetical protein